MSFRNGPEHETTSLIGAPQKELKKRKNVSIYDEISSGFCSSSGMFFSIRVRHLI